MNEPDRNTLRSYLLQTLSKRGMRVVEMHVQHDAAWAEALEEERRFIEKLDVLEELAAPEYLDERVFAGIAEQKRIRASRRRFAVAFAAGFLFFAAVFALRLGYAALREEEHEHLAEMNLKQLGLALKMFAAESQGERLPPLAPYKDLWIFDVSKLYPEYISDIAILAAPNRPGYRERLKTLQRLVAEKPPDWDRINRIAGEYFVYTAWVVTTPEEAKELTEARMQLAAADYDADLKLDDRTYYRLREGIERFLIQNINDPGATAMAQSNIPIMMQVPPREGPRWSKALFMDGHVESIAWDRANPVAAILDALLGALPRQPQ